MVKTRQQRALEAHQDNTSSAAQPPQPPSTAPPPQASHAHVTPTIPHIVLPSIEGDPSITGGQDNLMSNAAQHGDREETSHEDVDHEFMALRALNAMRESPNNAAYAREDQALRQASFESLQRRQNQDLHDHYSPRLPYPEAGVPDGPYARSDDPNREVPAPARRPLYYDDPPSFEELANRTPVYRPASHVDSEVNYGRAGLEINHTQPYDARPQGQYNPEPVYGYQAPPPLQYNPEPVYGYQPPPPVQLPPFGELLANADPMYQHLLRQVEDAERRAREAREEALDQINAAEEYAHDTLVQRQTLQARMHALEQEHQNAQGLLHDYVTNLRQRDVLLQQSREREEALQAQNAEHEEQLRQAQVQAEQQRQEAQAREQAAATLERELRRDIRIGNIDNRTLQMTIDHAADVRGLRHAMTDHDDHLRHHDGIFGQIGQDMNNFDERLAELQEYVHDGQGPGNFYRGPGNFRGPGRQVGGGEGGGPVRNQRTTSRGGPYSRSV